MNRLWTYPEPKHVGVFVRRYKRFFVDVQLHNGEVVAHTANTGAMTGMNEAGMQVVVTEHNDPKRKLKYSLQAVHDGGTWIGANPILSNRVAKEILTQGLLPDLAGYAKVTSEAKVSAGDHAGRLDFHLQEHPHANDAFVEVKSVTLRKDRLALFPDAVTERGRRHVELLHALLKQGHRAALLLLVQRADCARFSPAWDVDPAYCKALSAAAVDGLEVFAQEVVVDVDGISLGRLLPTSLEAPE